MESSEHRIFGDLGVLAVQVFTGSGLGLTKVAKDQAARGGTPAELCEAKGVPMKLVEVLLLKDLSERLRAAVTRGWTVTSEFDYRAGRETARRPLECLSRRVLLCRDCVNTERRQTGPCAYCRAEFEAKTVQRKFSSGKCRAAC